MLINNYSLGLIILLVINTLLLWISSSASPKQRAYRFMKQLIIYSPILTWGFITHKELGLIFIYNIGVILLFILCIVYTPRGLYKPKLYYTILHVTTIALLGAFSTNNIVWFYIFFESSLIPVFLLIIIWGTRTEKASAGFQLVLYTIFGSFLFLQGLLTLILWEGTVVISEFSNYILPENIEHFIFLTMFIGFMVKIPMFPFHLWLPKAHVEAPTAGSVLLAGVILKLGSYIFLRFFPVLFSSSLDYYRPYIVVLTVLGMIYTSLTILRQIDLKRIVAYSSIGHMNLVTYGCLCGNITSYYGAFLLSVAHGLASGGMFAVVGSIYDRLGTRNILYMRALTEIMPLTAFFFFAFTLSNFGFPPTLNFISELLLLTGVLQVSYVYAIVVLITMIFTGISSLWILTKIFYGNFLSLSNKIPQRAFSDLNISEILSLSSLLIFLLLLSVKVNSLIAAIDFFLIAA